MKRICTESVGLVRDDCPFVCCGRHSRLFAHNFLPISHVTGRFGRKGTAISLIDDQKSLETLAAIEQHFSKGQDEMIAKAEADPEALAEVIEI